MSNPDTITCKICGGQSGNRTHVAREMMFGLRDKFEYLECGSCGCLQLVTIPGDFAKYYPEDYYSFSFPASDRFARLRQCLQRARGEQLYGRPSLLGDFVVRWKGNPFPWLPYTQVKLDDSILDVGSGSGFLLKSMRSMGFKNAIGADPYIASEIKSGDLVVKKAFLAEIEGLFDLVMFHHSFEHMPDPEAILRETARLTRPGKFALIRIPLAGKAAWRKYGTDWVQLDAPRHLFLHTVQSMVLLAQKAGFLIEKVVYDSAGFQFWGSEQYKMDIPLMDPRSYAKDRLHPLFDEATIAEFDAIADQLNAQGDGDSASFYLRRKV